MKKEKDLTEKAVKKELRGYYYAGVHQYEGECAEDKFVDIVWCDQYGVSYESCYDGWDYIIRKVPDYEDVCSMESQIKRLQEQLKEANKALKEVCMHAETEQFECRCGWVEPCKDCNAHYSARNYLKKWGVK